MKRNFYLNGMAIALTEEIRDLELSPFQLHQLVPQVLHDVRGAQAPVKIAVCACTGVLGMVPTTLGAALWRLMKQLPIGSSVSQVLRGLMLVRLATDLAGQ